MAADRPRASRQLSALLFGLAELVAMSVLLEGRPAFLIPGPSRRLM